MSTVKSNSSKNNVISSLKIICIVMITGISFGILMSIVSNAFVDGVEFLFNSRDNLNFLKIHLFDQTITLAPLLSLAYCSGSNTFGTPSFFNR